MDSFGGYYNPAYNPYIYDCQEKIKEKYHDKLHCVEKCMMEGC